jgi:predicted acyltransferase
MHTNLGTAWDQWLVDLSPTDYLDRVHALGLTSLNFVPGVATVLAGMITGEFLRSPHLRAQKTAWLLRAGLICFVVGLVMSRTLCPMVKLIWTPSFAIFSTGWTLWLLAAFYWLIDVKGWRGWSLPLVVVGLNSIAIFILYFTIDWWIMKGWTVVLGRRLFESAYGPLWRSLATLAVLWGIAGALYWRRIFIRL